MVNGFGPSNLQLGHRQETDTTIRPWIKTTRSISLFSSLETDITTFPIRQCDTGIGATADGGIICRNERVPSGMSDGGSEGLSVSGWVN